MRRCGAGRVERADLLVGADGVGSRVASVLAGGPTSRPTGLGAIAGRAILTPDLRAALPALLREGPALAFDPSGFSVFLHVHDPSSGTVVDPAACITVPADLEPADIVWGINAAPAIRASLSPLAWQRHLARPVGHHAARLAFPTLALAHRLRSGRRP